MILILHKDNKVINVVDHDTYVTVSIDSILPLEALFELSKNYPHKLIAWCHYDLKEFINPIGFQETFHHRLVMASFEIREHNYISDRIGYVEASPFVNVNKNVTYPTWLMSSCVGGIYAEALLRFDVSSFKRDSFDYALNSIAKRGMLYGLFCYSCPILLQTNAIELRQYNYTVRTLFKFIKQHYKARWTFITFFNVLIYEKRFLLLPLLVSFFVAKKNSNPNFNGVKVKSNRRYQNRPSIDVVIPTIGRKDYLFDVLRDLSQQTLLPNQVIIVEQNPNLDSKSELNYLVDETWPFSIRHIFIHQTGACNARNVALKYTTAEFVFLADDDIRIDKHLLKEAIDEMIDYGLKAVTLSCLKSGENETVKNNMPWHTFGSGCSIVKISILNNVAYDLSFEHGFGEDGDFGMQIRNLGEDIGYLPNIRLLHLKAPIGGFRTKFKHPWLTDAIQPKPSPTVMLFNIKHQTKYQLLGYKTVLFFNYFRLQSNKNVFTYMLTMRKRWDRSLYWAQKLSSKYQKRDWK